VTIPALRGLALADARAALNSTGLSYYVLYRDSPRSEPDTVIDCDPAEGQVVPPDTRVTLVVARGASTSPSASATTTTPTPGG
jgi:beta-lactam-binding protein with PASTA domain